MQSATQQTELKALKAKILTSWLLPRSRSSPFGLNNLTTMDLMQPSLERSLQSLFQPSLPNKIRALKADLRLTSLLDNLSSSDIDLNSLVKVISSSLSKALSKSKRISESSNKNRLEPEYWHLFVANFNASNICNTDFCCKSRISHDFFSSKTDWSFFAVLKPGKFQPQEFEATSVNPEESALWEFEDRFRLWSKMNSWIWADKICSDFDARWTFPADNCLESSNQVISSLDPDEVFHCNCHRQKYSKVSI